MSDALFPSGPWVGFYHYSPQDKHRMDLTLTFAQGKVVGEGVDDVGRFVLRGRYDAAARECWWTKTYPGSHDVFYRGYREGKGIWGVWEIAVHVSGGFHIWPRAAGEEETAAVAQDEEIPIEASRAQPVTA